MKNTLLSFLTHWKWATLGVLSVLLNFGCKLSPELTEYVYSRGLFRIIRTIFDYSLGFLPFPAFYLFGFILLIVGIRAIRYIAKKGIPFSIKCWNSVYHILSFTGAIVFFFFLLWGYNYSRIPFDQQIGLRIESLDSTALQSELEAAATDAIASRKVVDSLGATPQALMDDLPNMMKAYVKKELQQNNFHVGKGPSGRVLLPNGILMRFGSTGLYLPWVGESNIDGAIHPLEKPFTMAHEISHGYGWGDEGTCNFIAYLACTHSTQHSVQYSGYLAYYRYVANNFKALHPKEYDSFRKTLPQTMRDDLDAINQRQKEYPEWISSTMWYDLYLKGNGMPEGLQNYSKVVRLVYSYRTRTI